MRQSAQIERLTARRCNEGGLSQPIDTAKLDAGSIHPLNNAHCPSDDSARDGVDVSKTWTEFLSPASQCTAAQLYNNATLSVKLI